MGCRGEGQSCGGWGEGTRLVPRASHTIDRLRAHRGLQGSHVLGCSLEFQGRFSPSLFHVCLSREPFAQDALVLSQGPQINQTN